MAKHKFKPGESGNPAGRPKGSQNRRTLALQNQLEELNCDPVACLSEILNAQMAIAREAITPTKKKKIPNKALALEAFADAEKTAADFMQYIFPKKKAVEHSGEANLFSFADFIALSKSGKKE